MYEDKTLVCKDCGAEFVFTAGEQEFYAEKGFVMSRSVARACRDAKKNASGNKPERKCSPLLVQLAARKQEYRFSREKTVRYIAANALQR